MPEDIYKDWTAAERERLQILYLDALTSLAQIYRKVPGDEFGYRRARDVLRKALAVDPYREDINHDLMELMWPPDRLMRPCTSSLSTRN